MENITEKLLEKKFIDSAVSIAKIFTNPRYENNMALAERNKKMAAVFVEFKRFIDENYKPIK